MKAMLTPVGSNELFGGSSAETSRADDAFALVCNSTSQQLEGAAAERPN
jgi:hypothetical protein